MSRRHLYPLYMGTVVSFMFVSGCALTSKSAPLELRFFTPTEVHRSLRSDVARPTGDLALRLGRIESGAHLEQRIAFRKSETELGYYQALRWTEPPAFYVRNELAFALFNERGVSRIVTGRGPTLDLELNEFEELLFGERRVRVGLRFVLRDEQRALVDEVVVVEEALGSSGTSTVEEALAQAMAVALSRATATVADRVVAKLGATASTTPIDGSSAATQ
jgi:ABC-type uncharacterized transport system auxiliary subunit